MPLRINVFPGIQNIPNLAAEQQGFFETRNILVQTDYTSSSQEQRSALAEGRCDVAHSAIDNALAMADAGTDVVVVMGLDAGFNKLMARPDLTSLEQLRGCSFGVDAPDTAFALLGYEMLRRAGLERDRDYAVRVVGATGQRLQALQDGAVDFTLLMLPFNLAAQATGLRSLGDPLDVVGAYQSTGAFVSRDWARRNPVLLEHYLAAYTEGLRWALDPANEDGVLALLRDRLRLDAGAALECYRQSCRSPKGFRIDAILDQAGVNRVVALRDAFSPRPDGLPRDPEAYLDLSYHHRALAGLATTAS